MKTNRVPKISTFAKGFIVVMAMVPIAMAIWLVAITSSQDAQGRYLVFVTIAGLLLISCLLIPYMIRIASTEFSPEGVKQIAFFRGGRFGAPASLKWQSIESVSYKQLAYKLFGNGEKISIYLGCFSDYKEVADYINSKLPRSVVWK